MKSVWLIVATLALANLLAIAGFVGWLKATDRLDMARIQKVREVLAPTRAQEMARQAEDQVKAESEKKTAEQKTRDALPAETAAAQIDGRTTAAEMDRQRVLKLREEVRELQRSLETERRVLDTARAQLDAERKSFNEERKKIAQIDGGAQFKKALGVYETLKPAEAKAAMQELLRAPSRTEAVPTGTAPSAPGVSPQGMDQVLAYLNAMQAESRTKVIKEFVKDDPRMAADLLERLRTRGVEAPGTAGP
jgi:hypothetical protein